MWTIITIDYNNTVTIYGKGWSPIMRMDRKKLYFIIGGAAAAVLIVALLLVLLLGGGKGKKYEKYYRAAEAAFLVRDYDKAMKNLDKAMAIDATEECYLLRPMHWVIRALCVIAGVCLIYASVVTDVVGILVLVAVFVLQLLENRRATA